MTALHALSGKIVWITGASSGIGAEMAREFARLGAIPVLTARSEEKLRRIAADISGEHDWQVLDVTSAQDVERVAAYILGKYGTIDILVNNAGYGVFEMFKDTPLAAFEDMMNVNYMGMVRCTKAALPHMLKNGKGHIVNIASMAGKIGSAKSAGYSATKHAVLGFTNCLRQELIGTGVHITAINPGPIDTPFFDRADPTGTYVNNVKWFMLKPAQVVQAVIRSIVRKRPEIDLPFVAGFSVKMYQLFPRLFDKIAFRLLNRK